MGEAGDVRLQLNDLEAEEARIMRELREMDEKAHAESEANKRRAEQYKEDPEAALTSLLLECEKEVRDAKGYIADQGPPLRIVRLRRGETGPKSATYLSRPRNTGVDFTVPVTLKAYTDLIKRPIFLNQIRDKIKQHKYSSTEDYLEDMRLLVQNTAQFNKGPDLAWVVQHARFLLDAAEDAVTSRRRLFREVEEALRQKTTQKLTRQNTSTLSAVGKRKRSHTQEKTNGDISAVPAVGSAIEIYWPSYRKWYLAYITAHGDGGTCHLRYDEDNSLQWVTLDHERWRMRNSRFTGAARGKRAHEQPTKKRKGSTAASPTSDQPVLVSGGITPEDLDAIKIDLFAKFDDLRDSIMEQLKDHLARMDRAVIRSDALSRILIQVEDTQAKVESAMESMQKGYENLEKRVCESLRLTQSNGGGTRPEAEPEQQADAQKEVQIREDNHEKGTHSEDLARGTSPRLKRNRPGPDTDIAETIEGGEKKRIQTEEKAMGNRNRDVDGEVEISRSNTETDKAEQRSPSGDVYLDSGIDQGQNSKDLVATEHTKGGKAIQESKVNSEVVDVSKEDVKMTDVTEVNAQDKGRSNEGEANHPTRGDSVKVSTLAVSDSKELSPGAKTSKLGNQADEEADSIVEGARDEKEGSIDSNESEDFASDDSDVHRGIAEKKPATRRTHEVEISSQIGAKGPGNQSRVIPDEDSPAWESPKAEMRDVADEEREDAKAEDAVEKSSEEIKTVATSGAASEARENGKKDRSGSKELSVTGEKDGD